MTSRAEKQARRRKRQQAQTARRSARQLRRPEFEVPVEGGGTLASWRSIEGVEAQMERAVAAAHADGRAANGPVPVMLLGGATRDGEMAPRALELWSDWSMWEVGEDGSRRRLEDN